MNEVWLVHTINADLSENEIKVFFSKSLAQVFAWDYYMKNCFYGDDAEDDWESLILDNTIYCDIEGVGNVKSIWMTQHRIVENLEPKINLVINLKNEKRDS